MTEDLILVRRAQKGDTQAFQMLMQRYQDRLYYLVIGMVNHKEDTEDLLQEIFIKVFKALPRFRGDSQVGSWMHRIAVNTCIDHCRTRSKKQKLVQSRLDDPEDATLETMPYSQALNPEQEMENTMIQQHIQNALRQISPRERAIFVMRHYQDMPLKEIARELKISLGTVKSTLFRALKRMQQELAFLQTETERAI